MRRTPALYITGSSPHQSGTPQPVSTARASARPESHALPAGGAATSSGPVGGRSGRAPSAGRDRAASEPISLIGSGARSQSRKDIIATAEAIKTSSRPT